MDEPGVLEECTLRGLDGRSIGGRAACAGEEWSRESDRSASQISHRSNFAVTQHYQNNALREPPSLIALCLPLIDSVPVFYVLPPPRDGCAAPPIPIVRALWTTTPSTTCTSSCSTSRVALFAPPSAPYPTRACSTYSYVRRVTDSVHATAQGGRTINNPPTYRRGMPPHEYTYYLVLLTADSRLGVRPFALK